MPGKKLDDKIDDSLSTGNKTMDEKVTYTADEESEETDGMHSFYTFYFYILRLVCLCDHHIDGIRTHLCEQLCELLDDMKMAS